MIRANVGIEYFGLEDHRLIRKGETPVGYPLAAGTLAPGINLAGDNAVEPGAARHRGQVEQFSRRAVPATLPAARPRPARHPAAIRGAAAASRCLCR